MNIFVQHSHTLTESGPSPLTVCTTSLAPLLRSDQLWDMAFNFMRIFVRNVYYYYQHMYCGVAWYNYKILIFLDVWALINVPLHTFYKRIIIALAMH